MEIIFDKPRNVQTLTAKVFVDTEIVRSIIGEYQDCCNVCFLHKFKKGLELVHGLCAFGKQPYYKQMRIRILTDDWKTRTLPFVATMVAECADESPCLISNILKDIVYP